MRVRKKVDNMMYKLIPLRKVAVWFNEDKAHLFYHEKPRVQGVTKLTNFGMFCDLLKAKNWRII